MKPYYTAGQKTKPPKYTVNDPCHNQLQMIYILDGELVLYANDETTGLGPGDVLLLRVGCEFRYTCLYRIGRGHTVRWAYAASCRNDGK